MSTLASNSPFHHKKHKFHLILHRCWIIFHHKKHKFHLILHRYRKQEDLIVMTSSEQKQRLRPEPKHEFQSTKPLDCKIISLRKKLPLPNSQSTAPEFRSNLATKTTHHHSRDNPIASNTHIQAYAKEERGKRKGCEPWERQGPRRRRRHETTPPSPATGTANPSESTRGESAARTEASRGRRGVKTGGVKGL